MSDHKFKHLTSPIELSHLILCIAPCLGQWNGDAESRAWPLLHPRMRDRRSRLICTKVHTLARSRPVWTFYCCCILIDCVAALSSASLSHACPKGIYVAPLPSNPLAWSGVLFVRKGKSECPLSAGHCCTSFCAKTELTVDIHRTICQCHPTIPDLVPGCISSTTTRGHLPERPLPSTGHTAHHIHIFHSRHWLRHCKRGGRRSITARRSQSAAWLSRMVPPSGR
jgi:hypothetical protein